MAENTKMEVDGNASETIDKQEAEENMDEDADEESDSSDSDASDGNEAVHDPKVQQLELQVLSAFLHFFHMHNNFSPRGRAHVNSCRDFIDFSQAIDTVMFHNTNFRRDIVV